MVARPRETSARCAWYCCRILRPFGRTGRRIDADDAIRPHSQFAQLASDAAGFLDLRQEPAAFRFVSHRRAAAGRGPDRRNQRSGTQAFAGDFFSQARQIVVGRIDIGVRQGEEQIDAVEPHAVHLRGLGQVQHGIEIDRRLGVRPFADQSRPHGIVKSGRRMHVIYGT